MANQLTRMEASLRPHLCLLVSFPNSNQSFSRPLSSVDSISNVSHSTFVHLPLRSIPNLFADPIIDPSEFCARFFEFSKGNCNALGIPGQLIAMLLTVWAASFGVNEYGIEELHHGEAVIRNRREVTNEMVREMLQLIDIHGILRKPTWDGVRALHLLLPLTQGLSEARLRYLTILSMRPFRGPVSHGTTRHVRSNGQPSVHPL
jgi:hypothetical protein